MTKIIPFKPNNQPDIEIKQNQSQQSRLSQLNQQLQEDSVEFVDYNLDDVSPAKKTKKVVTKLADSQLTANALDVYNSVRKARRNLNELISYADKRDYVDFLNLKGNLVTFEQDALERIVMIECDEKGRDERRTTFTSQDNNIVSTETSYEKIVFFGYGKDYIEVTKITKPNLLGKSTKEVFCYENGKPVAYSKYALSAFKDDVLTEKCIF